jgi:hypothetical protein
MTEWQHAGRARRDRYGVTVTPAGQSVWLDDRHSQSPHTTTGVLAAPHSP